MNSKSMKNMKFWMQNSYIYLFLTLLFLFFKKSEIRHPFSLYHIKDALTVTFKKRPGPNRKYLFLMMLMMIIYIVPFYGEFTISFLFVRSVFKWDVKEYSQYSSIVSSVSIVGKPKIWQWKLVFHLKGNSISSLKLSSKAQICQNVERLFLGFLNLVRFIALMCENSFPRFAT